MSLSSEQKALRRTGIGSSEIAAIVGLCPYSTAIDVWRAKVEGYETPQTPAMRRGQLLEPVVAQMYAEETGAELLTCSTVRHSRHPIALATPDGIAAFPAIGPDETRVLEIKTANSRMFRQWGEPGTDEVPRAYLCQVAWEMACVELERADVAVLLAGDDFRIYHLTRDVELEGMLIERAEKFWRDYVETKRPPPLDGSSSCAEWLSARHPRDDGQIIASTPETEGWMRELESVRGILDLAEKRGDELKNNIKSAIGDANGMIGARWKVSWKTQTRESTEWNAVRSELKIPSHVIEKFTRTTQFRVFRPTWDAE